MSSVRLAAASERSGSTSLRLLWAIVLVVLGLVVLGSAKKSILRVEFETADFDAANVTFCCARCSDAHRRNCHLVAQGDSSLRPCRVNLKRILRQQQQQQHQHRQSGNRLYRAIPVNNRPSDKLLFLPWIIKPRDDAGPSITGLQFVDFPLCLAQDQPRHVQLNEEFGLEWMRKLYSSTEKWDLLVESYEACGRPKPCDVTIVKLTRISAQDEQYVRDDL